MKLSIRTVFKFIIKISDEVIYQDGIPIYNQIEVCFLSNEPFQNGAHLRPARVGPGPGAILKRFIA